VNDASKVLYVRNPRDRVEKAAPFLQVDGDPYPAVVNGRITWILDGYTTSEYYPYSERMELGQAAQDSFTGAGTTALPNQQFNYIRNSVKATVDAYDGSVSLYAWDAKDPVLKTYMKAFPGVIKPRSAMSDELVGHVRYPEDLFKLQRDILTRYHVMNPVDFYNGNDRWQVPNDPTRDSRGDPQPPYYILAQRPSQEGATFQLTSALNAFNRENLSAFISATSDPGNYGQIQVLRLPGNTPFQGPRQVQQSFNTNAKVSQDLTLFRNADAQPVFGNLLTLPIGNNGLLYVEPLYVEGRGASSFPLLRRVLVNYANRVGYAETLSEALDQVFGAGAGQSATDSNGSPTPSPSTGSAGPSTSPPADGGGSNPALDQAVSDLDQALAALQDAQRSGDFAAQGQALADLQRAVEAYRQAEQQTSSAAPSSSASASPTG
jgi:uncharacterized membrane protein (UPF0182 family)